MNNIRFKINNLFERLMGNPKSAGLEFRVFNAVALLSAAALFVNALINALIGHLAITFFMLFLACLSSIEYYLCRVKQKLGIALMLFGFLIYSLGHRNESYGVNEIPSNQKFFKGVIFVIGMLFFAILNLAWNYYSDYKLSYWIGYNIYKINIGDYYYSEVSQIKKNSIWLLNSVYSIGGVTHLVLMLLAGYVTVKMIALKLQLKELGWILKLLFVILWLLKIPVKFEYSNYITVERALFAW